MNSKISKFVFGTSILLSICGCGQTATYTEDDESKYRSQTYKLVEKHIYEMAAKSWDKSSYIEIRDNQITRLSKKSEKNSATVLLDVEYSKLLVRDADSILSEGCTANRISHELLKKLFVELKAYPKVPGLQEITSLKKLHDEAEYFVNTAVGRQRVTAYTTKYDESYENKKIQEAKKYLNNSSLKCKNIRNRLQVLTKSSGYNSRRLAYCQKVVSLYLQSSDSLPRDLNSAKANINICPRRDSLTVWKNKMDEHFNELNKDEQNEEL